MALLATSCTMLNKPSRLLDKGPDYLRTRTNTQLFAHRRKSAVELLAASKPQYVKSHAVLDTTLHDLAITPDRPHRPPRSREKQLLPTRSKSEFNISRLQELDSDETDGAARAHADGDTDEQTADTPDVNALTSDPAVACNTSQEDSETTSSGALTTTTTTATTATTGAITPADTERKRPGEIDSAADREDEREFSSAPPACNTPATAALTSTTTTPTTPTSTQPPPLPPKPKPRLKPKPTVAQAGPVIYTAKPIYINLATGTSQPGNTATTTAAGAATHHTTITAITASQAAGLSAMSEESSDKTPTNPTGGDVGQVTHLSASTPVEEGAACAGRLDGNNSSDVTVGAVIANAVSMSASGTSSSPRQGALHVADLTNSGAMGYPVPRSFSDICHHSRAGSDVSSEASRASRTSRASRASAGANLEKFFNEMGMEKDILDPMLRRQQRFADGSELDLYESVSSLDSHDARSICSAFSRTEREVTSSDAESLSDRSQQQTSVVERNARIIKWLCSVKKAKQNPPGFQGSAS